MMLYCVRGLPVRLGRLCLQASFDPPGLSIAVKKDRAVETMLVTGNKFNVNVLAQGKEKVLPFFTHIGVLPGGRRLVCGFVCFTMQCCMIGLCSAATAKLVFLLCKCVFALHPQPCDEAWIYVMLAFC